MTRHKINLPKNIWMVTREYDALAGAGGVKDACSQLAEALVRRGRKVSVVLPCYGFMNPGKLGFKPLGISFAIDMPYVGRERREEVRFWHQGHGPEIYLVEAQRYLEKRDVYTYTADDEADNPMHPKGTGHGDYFAMNVLLQKAAINLMIYKHSRPDIVHCQDGHTAILPAMIREVEGYRQFFRRTGAVVTIHNAGYGYHQEVGDLPFAETICGLPERVITDNLLDGKFDPLLAAASYAAMNTVSENYARELRETDDDKLTGWLGHRLMARGVKLEGITNGINPDRFDPSCSGRLGLPAGFDPGERDLAGKQVCRMQLIKEIQGGWFAEHVKRAGTLDFRPGQPLFTFIGRLMEQKGVDKLVKALESLLREDRNFQALILGAGTSEIEQGLLRLTDRPDNTGRICILRGFDPLLANRIYAAGDFFLIPSRYEPCGMTDFIAQLFGNLPIVRLVGGLVKVKNGETGFAYREHSAAALAQTMRKAMRIFRTSPDRIRDMQQNAVRHIKECYTWDTVVQRYDILYKEAMDMLPGQRV